MAKIWRRKRKGHEIGSFHVLVKGKPTNLRTNDARLANKRARLALRGEWPDDAPARAAEVAAPAEHVPEIPPPEQNPAEKAEGAQAPGPQPAGLAESPPPAAEPILGPDPLSVAAEAASEASGEGAAFSVGSGDGDLAAEVGAALQREFFPAGGDAEGDLGKMGAALCLSLEHQLGELIARRRKPPRTIPEPTEQDVYFRALKVAFGVWGRRWTKQVAIHPFWVIVAVLTAYPIQMALTAEPVGEEKPKAPEAN